MRIRRSKSAWSPVEIWAYISRQLQTQIRILGPTLLRRTAQKQDLPHLPGPLRRTARNPEPGQGLFTPFSHAADILMFAQRWKPPCPSQQPFYALTYGNLRVLRSRRKLLQTSHEPTGDLVASDEGIAQQRYSVQPNAHLHGGIGVTKKYKQIK